MGYSYNKLKGKIVELYGTRAAFADKLGISETSLSKKLQGKTNFSQADIVKWGNLLGIDAKDYVDYFFC